MWTNTRVETASHPNSNSEIFMKKCTILVALLALGLCGLNRAMAAAPNPEEGALILKLESKAPAAEKEPACAKLKLIGTARSVPTLAALLADDQLSHSARYALEAMQSPEAGSALITALGQTSGQVRIGIIYSLGFRGETRAVSSLTKLLSDTDPGTTAAAATALGQIGGPQALAALEACAAKTSGPTHAAAVDGILRCADHLLTAGAAAKARKVFERLYDSEKSPTVRVAAFRGVLLASGDAGLKLMTSALTGQAGPARTAALQLAKVIQVRGATEALAAILPKLEVPVQIALVGCLAQRGDPAAAQPIAALAGRCDARVRPVIIQALSEIGDASMVPFLADFAAAGNADDQKAARLALLEIRRGNVTDLLLSRLGTASPAVQSELVRALGARGDVAAVPWLEELARTGSDSVRPSALLALGALVNPAQISSLVQLAIHTKTEADRNAATEALNAVCQRAQAGKGRLDVGALARGLVAGSGEGRITLMQACSGLVSLQIRSALRGAAQDPDAQVQAAATRAICDTADPELLEDVVNIARQTKDDGIRTLAINGAVRLVTQEDAAKVPVNSRVTTLQSLLAVATRPEQKRAVLAGLAEVPALESLKLVESTLEDPALRNEAARAAIKLAAALGSSQSAALTSVLKQALAGNLDDGTRKAVEQGLKQLEALADYLTLWQVSGPYEQAGKDYAALFDVVFPPESGGAQDTKWRMLPSATDPARPFVMDILRPWAENSASLTSGPGFTRIRLKKPCWSSAATTG